MNVSAGERGRATWSRGTGALWLVPLLLYLLLAGGAAWRAASITQDSVLFIRSARQLAGLQPPPDVDSSHRSPWMRAFLDRLGPFGKVAPFDHQHPGYPALIALVHGLLGGEDPLAWSLAAQVASLLGGAVAVLAIVAVGARTFGPAAGIVAGIVVALSPVMVRTSADALSDSWSIAFLALSALFACRMLDRRGLADAAGLGIASGWGYLVRPEAIQVAVVAAAGLAASLAFGRRTDRGRAFALLLAVCAPAGLFAAPYMAIKGSPWTKKAHLLAPGAMPRTNETTIAPAASPTATAAPLAPASPGPTSRPASSPRWSRLAQAYGRFLDAWARCVGLYFFPSILFGLATSGIRGEERAGRRLLLAVLLLNATGLPLGLYVSSGYLDNRHVLPAAMLSTAWSWAGLVTIAGLVVRIAARLQEKFRAAQPMSPARQERLAVDISSLAVALAVPLFAFVNLRTPLNLQRAGYRDMAVVLAHRIGPDEKVFDPAFLAAFYAGLDERNAWKRDPYFTAERLEHQLAAEQGLRLLVLSDGMLRSMRQPGGLPERLGSAHLVEIEALPESHKSVASDRLHLYMVRRDAVGLR